MMMIVDDNAQLWVLEQETAAKSICSHNIPTRKIIRTWDRLKQGGQRLKIVIIAYVLISFLTNIPLATAMNEVKLINRELQLTDFQVGVVLNLCPEKQWDDGSETEFAQVVAKYANEYCKDNLDACRLQQWSEQAQFTLFHVQYVSIEVRHDLSVVRIYLLILFNANMWILSGAQDTQNAMLPKRAAAAMIKEYGSSIESDTGWEVVDSENDPKYGAVTAWMNRALLPLGLLLAVLVLMVARWSVSITASSELDLVMRIQKKRLKVKEDRLHDFRARTFETQEEKELRMLAEAMETDSELATPSSVHYADETPQPLSPEALLHYEDEDSVDQNAYRKPKRLKYSQTLPSIRIHSAKGSSENSSQRLSISKGDEPGDATPFVTQASLGGTPTGGRRTGIRRSGRVGQRTTALPANVFNYDPSDSSQQQPSPSNLSTMATRTQTISETSSTQPYYSTTQATEDVNQDRLSRRNEDRSYRSDPTAELVRRQQLGYRHHPSGSIPSLGASRPSIAMQQNVTFIGRVWRRMVKVSGSTGQSTHSAEARARRIHTPRRAQVKTKMMMPMKVRRGVTTKKMSTATRGGHGFL